MANRIGAHAAAGLAGVAALMLTATLTACTGGGSASSSASAASTAHDVPTGKQLRTILLGAADLPHDYTEESIGAQNSGATLSAAASTVDLSSADCNTVLNLINTVGQNSLGEASYASDAFTPPSGLGEFDETLLEFHGTDATTFTNKLGAALNRCSAFQASDASGATQSASVKVTPGPRIGDESVGFTVKVAIGNQTMVMNGAAIRLGTAVAVIDNSLLQGQSTEIDLTKLAGMLVPRMRSVH